jgi:hypothetical protein
MPAHGIAGNHVVKQVHDRQHAKHARTGQA